MPRSRKQTESKRPRQRKAMPQKQAVPDNVCEYCGRKKKFRPTAKHGMKCQKCRAKGIQTKLADRPKPPEPIPSNEWVCQKCGHKNPEELMNCDKCNQSQSIDDAPKEV